MTTHDAGSGLGHGIAKPHTGWIHGHFKSKDGTMIFYRFHPSPGARHTVIMLHGYGEHSGRYEKFPGKMERLSAQFAVMDLRGMGRSEGARGDLVSFDDYLDDVTAFVEHLRRKHLIPHKFILFGHSLGALVATSWAMKNPDPIKMLILSAPFLGLRFSWFILPMNRLILFFMPRFVYKSPVWSKNLSHDHAEVAAYKNDPLILHHISGRLLYQISERMEVLRKHPVLSVPFPVHLLAVGVERIVDPSIVHRFFNRLVSPRKERTIFEGFFHEIFNERDQQRTFNVLKTIIEDCV